MECRYACGTSDHQLARRQFLGAITAGSVAASGSILGGLSFLTQPAAAATLSKQQKRVLVVNMAGGLSQLESWDPKPGTPTGGPFRAISSSVPGIQVCELVPQTAKQLHHLAIVRSVDTSEDDHGKGHYMMFTGRRQNAGGDFPRIGAVAAKALASEASGLPGHIQITAGGGGRTNDAAYLGPKYAGVILGDGQPPQNSARPDAISQMADDQRNALRRSINERFLSRRRTAMTDAYTHSYEQAQQLMAQREIFDVTKESDQDRARYGKHDFGRHCLLARRLLENGITFVQVTHTNYDTHNENFNFHLEQLGEFDTPFATLVADLADRGMLESTLVVILSEFGRTPKINGNYGRDHWGKAWSVLLGGCGIKAGAVIGKTNDHGTEVTDAKADHANLFHTYLRAVGVDTSGSFEIDGRSMPIADPASRAIKEILV